MSPFCVNIIYGVKSVMMISTKGRYGLRFLIDIAEHQPEGFIPLKEVAERQGISEKYLEIIVKDMMKGGLLTALRGKGGGYRLSRPAEEYSVRDIILLMEGSVSPVLCLEDGADGCPRRQDCRTLPLWQGLDEVISEYLDRFTLKDLCENK